MRVYLSNWGSFGVAKRREGSLLRLKARRLIAYVDPSRDALVKFWRGRRAHAR